MSNDKLLDKQAVDIVRHLQRLKGINGDYDNDSGSSGDRVGRRRTIYNIEKQRQKTRTIGTLDVAFRKRFLQMKMEEGEDNAGQYKYKLSEYKVDQSFVTQVQGFIKGL